MIIFIHGFGSSGFAQKATILKDYFGEKVFSPSLSYIPKLAINTLEEMIRMALFCDQKVSLVGSSMGGYYATYLADKYDLKVVLINPVVYPPKTLTKYIGNAQSYFDLSSYEWTSFHVDSLNDYMVESPKLENFMLLLQMGDDVIDYRDAKKKFEDATLLIEEGGSHGYDEFETKMEIIQHFFATP